MCHTTLLARDSLTFKFFLWFSVIIDGFTLGKTCVNKSRKWLMGNKEFTLPGLNTWFCFELLSAATNNYLLDRTRNRKEHQE